MVILHSRVKRSGNFLFDSSYGYDQDYWSACVEGAAALHPNEILVTLPALTPKEQILAGHYRPIHRQDFRPGDADAASSCREGQHW